ncbi:hypothetical protein AVEN_26559-1 [Araneus ventricosus]|uniref:Uncharacterized protein n=1 Tax=Araneus ventricosus TaxID=182803 RepID=A0A4Y2FQA5_ARAVE|nr:hypothetical protein AVEN_26559-1 [Araneus ventricosus]
MCATYTIPTSAPLCSGSQCRIEYLLDARNRSTQNAHSVSTKKSPPCLCIREQFNGSRCYSSSTEIGVLIAYHQTTARSLQKEVRAITGGRQHTPNHYCTHQGSEILLTYTAVSHP